MSVVAYKYTCANCGHKFEASGIPELSYGNFIMRSITGEEAFLQATTNSDFLEILKMSREYKKNKFLI